MQRQAGSILCLIVLAVPGVLRADPHPSDDPRPVGLAFAEEHLRQKLHNPPTAQFDQPQIDRGFNLLLTNQGDNGRPVQEKVTVEEGCVVTWKDGSQSTIVSVSGMVRAKSNINTLVASTWRVIMTHDNRDDWKALVVMLQDKDVYYQDPAKGADFLRFLLDRERQRKEQLAEEQARQAEQQRRKQELQDCHDAGAKAGQKTAEKFGKNVKTAPAELVNKQATKSLEATTYTDPEEMNSYLEGFQAGYDAVKRKHLPAQ